MKYNNHTNLENLAFYIYPGNVSLLQTTFTDVRFVSNGPCLLILCQLFKT